jgi:ring-1,2-phenylacetyl-CoA epoxidase subunit PaaD
VVTSVTAPDRLAGPDQLARAAAAAVGDPELPPVTISELGILRDVAVDADSGRVTVKITPTYAGCPALDMIGRDVRRALRAAGFRDVVVETVLAPPWTTDWISESGRAKLTAAGIAPPGPATPPGHAAARGAAMPDRAPQAPVALRLAVRCPHCGSAETEQLSRFGSTACKALWRCRACAEPFDAIKAF